MGEAIGEVDEKARRTLQIRETIYSHLEKEEKLFKKHIKVLSLFFVDKVDNYRTYDDSGQAHLGEYGEIFEREFKNILESQGHTYDPDYIAELKKIPINKIHDGYFSVDKQNHFTDGERKKDTNESDDASAYDRILKDKEALLNSSTPLRFIFSHSALSEGWDNPNVFQICALKHSSSEIRRRQEVGRGMRICVNDQGERQDFSVLGPDFHKVNKLTVLADESYEDFVRGLQTETLEELRERAVKVTIDSLTGKKVIIESGEVYLDPVSAGELHYYLIVNQYLDKDYLPTEQLLSDLAANTLVPFPKGLEKYQSGLPSLLSSIADPQAFHTRIENGRKTKIECNPFNGNQEKPGFEKIWSEINPIYQYHVNVNSTSLIGAIVGEINERVRIYGASYTVRTGAQRDTLTYEEMKNKDGFDESTTRLVKGYVSTESTVPYDLIGRIVKETNFTRKAIAEILRNLNNNIFEMYKVNPELFITKVSRIINEQKGLAVVKDIVYEPTGRRFDYSVFTNSQFGYDATSVIENKDTKNVQRFIPIDSKTEYQFAKDLEASDEVEVFAKLPKGNNGYYIPTPVGNYTPDWAIVFNKDLVKHLYFIAETKGTESKNSLDPIEDSKIKCAKKIFEKNPNISFLQVDTLNKVLGRAKNE